MQMPNYPHQKPGKGDPPWIDIGLYSIVGWFSQEFSGGTNAVAFGGYLKVATDPSDTMIDGLIVDSYGPAEIRGEMTETTLTFSKQYHGGSYGAISQPIQYKFEKKEDGKWHGNYDVPGYPMPADTRAVCQISPAIENAFGIMTGKPRRGF
jgi:hypothetical protein